MTRDTPDQPMWEMFKTIVEPGSSEEALLARIDPSSIPRHVAIIMDGNGRWANQHGRPRIDGHREGSVSVRVVTETAARLKINHLTLYAFSTENWKRPKAEVDALMQLLRQYLQEDLPTMKNHNIRFRALGRIEDMDFATRKLIHHTESVTARHTGMQLNVALNYGGRTEIVDAVRQIAKQVQNQSLAPEQINESLFGKNLLTDDQPDPDLLIRTSGELRISNFMLWQIAYAEFYFTPTYWPDFRLRQFLEAIVDYQSRTRRYGGVQQD